MFYRPGGGGICSHCQLFFNHTLGQKSERGRERKYLPHCILSSQGVNPQAEEAPGPKEAEVEEALTRQGAVAAANRPRARQGVLAAAAVPGQPA